MIASFSGEHRFLSNFYPCSVAYEGMAFPSVENAYQAAKYPRLKREVFMTCTPGQAKRLGQKCKLPENWEQNKVDVMRLLIAQKFWICGELTKMLLATGTQILIEGNTWGDEFWGMVAVDNKFSRGQNRLGLLLMERREFLWGFAAGATIPAQ